ncbi:MAG TPA: hypothetical protein VG015_09800 [Candidatus Dormibacteraeota bacterium]|nr:hypothetical protein [Candidatus Dormibacteraeota bacterium]
MKVATVRNLSVAQAGGNDLQTPVKTTVNSGRQVWADLCPSHVRLSAGLAGEMP